MRLNVRIFLAVLAIGALVAAVPGIFEPKPRVVATGRDPMIFVRASGAVSITKYEKGNLWLHTSFDGGDSFEPPVRVNDVDGEVTSHGESSPQLQVKSRSEFYCLWQTRRPGGEGSALRFARSMNWGESFHKAIDIEPGNAEPSQSFYTLNVSTKGIVYAAWLDGRDRGKGRAGTSAVYLARSANKGAAFEKPVRVALDVCPCCRPSIGFGGDGVVYVSWRGVTEGNVRDIHVASSTDDGQTFSAASRVAEDNWVLNGCPHSGASISSIGKRMFLAWHTVRDRQNRLYLAYSDDQGRTFSPRIDASSGVLDPNHPQLVSMGDRVALVFQGRDKLASASWAPVSAYYRELDAAGKLTALEKLGTNGGSASYPAIAFEDPDRVFMAWTEPRNEEKVVVLARGRRKVAPGSATVSKDIAHEH